jgi:hypothetical protein
VDSPPSAWTGAGGWSLRLVLRTIYVKLNGNIFFIILRTIEEKMMVITLAPCKISMGQ